MCNVVQLFLAANNILLMRKWNHAFLCLAIALAWKWQIAALPKDILRWSNDKTIIELGYRKISWFVSVSQINYLPQPSASANNWSTHHWQNLTNHDKHITEKSRYFAQPGPIIANYLPTLLPNISLVPRRSRLGQSWTLPWAVTSPRDTRRERLANTILSGYCNFSRR